MLYDTPRRGVASDPFCRRKLDARLLALPSSASRLDPFMPLCRERSRRASGILPRCEPGHGLAPDTGRYRVAALELSVPDLVAGALELGMILRLHRLIGSTASRVPWETKMRGEPACAAGAMKPGENDKICSNKSPFVIPKESA